LKRMNWKTAASAAVALTVLFGAFAPTSAAALAEDRTSKFRVYQNSNALQEFSDRHQAITYASGFKNTYVEQIGTRAWVWNNFPLYKVYQKNYSKPEWEFHSLEAAIAEARKWGNASVRKLSDGGWMWDNYPDHPGFTLYQGEKTLPGWTFPSLAKAQAEAKKWANAHIIDNADNKWVWDNIPDAREKEFRAGSKTYRVYQGHYTQEAWSFAYLQDAMKESLKWANAVVVNTSKQDAVVFRNHHAYVVLQQGAKKASFVGLQAAVDYASKRTDTAVLWDNRRIWSNEPYYTVIQTGKRVSAFSSAVTAAEYGMTLENAEVYTLDGLRVWDNLKELLYLAWNGSANHNTIMSHVSATQGLDIDSPSWFSLQDAAGTLKDESNPATVALLKTQGIKVHPLVHNQFNSKLTSEFLANADAQNAFITKLVARLAELHVDGVNIDFESMAGSDRDRYTAFVKALSLAAKAKGLTVSIDLPRGSVLWNHKTAFDHEKLHAYVDYVAIMTYDQFYRGSESAGPVAGMSWTEQGVEEFLSYGIPRAKLLLGVPFYIRVWETDAAGKLVSNRAVWMKDVPELLKEAEVTRTSDPRYGLDKVQYTKDGKQYIFWLEDTESIMNRVDIAKRHDLAGVAAWRLGYEPSGLWTELLRAK
jgi:spore germination protein YaaH